MDNDKLHDIDLGSLMLKSSERTRKRIEDLVAEYEKVNKYYEEYKKRIMQTRENEP